MCFSDLLVMPDLTQLECDLLPFGLLEAGRKRPTRKPMVSPSTPPPHEPPPPTTLARGEFPPDEPLPLWQMKITQTAFLDAMSHMLSRDPEVAGILIGPMNDDSLVTRFISDSEGRGTPVTFELNSVHLNRLLKELKPAGLGCKGIIHSHPAGYPQPSYGDVHYFQTLFGRAANSATTYIYTPIVCDGRMFPDVFTRGRVFSARLVLV